MVEANPAPEEQQVENQNYAAADGAAAEEDPNMYEAEGQSDILSEM